MTPNSSGEAARKTGEPITATQVEAYLRENPAFLRDNSPLLLEILDPPRRWADDGVLDLQAFLIERQRSEIGRLRASRSELIDASRAYLSNLSRTHDVALALIAARNIEELAEALSADLTMQLDVDAVAVCFEKGAAGDRLEALPVRWLEPGNIDRLLGGAKDVLLQSEGAGDLDLFGAATDLVGSAGLVRLRPTNEMSPGLLAMGSRNTAAFGPGMGTDHLAFLGRVLEQCLRRWLD